MGKRRRSLRGKCRLFRRRARRFLVHTVLHADDPPHKLALGSAIGVFITFTPTIGFQMMLNVFFCWLFRANKLIGIPIVWISNPVTFIPIYYPSYLFGAWLMGIEGVGLAWFEGLVDPANMPETGKWDLIVYFWEALMEIAIPLWVGCLVVATVLGVPTYFLVLFLVKKHRMHRFGQLIPPGAEDEGDA